MNSGPQDS